MLVNYRRIIKSAVLRPLLAFIPKVDKAVAVTFHNIEPEFRGWFDDVLDLISREYGFLDPKQMLSGSDSRNSGTLKVLLTFDDGFYSNRLVAEESMAKYGAKGLFFLAEGFVGLEETGACDYAREKIFPLSGINENEIDRYHAMTWTDVEWLQSQGHSVGAHTVNHRALSVLETNELKHDEIVGSADRLAKICNQDITSFAFPFGQPNSIDEDSFVMASKRFTYIFSNVRGNLVDSPSDCFLYRQNLVPGDPMWLVRAIIEGKLDWKYRKVQQTVVDLFFSERT